MAKKIKYTNVEHNDIEIVESKEEKNNKNSSNTLSLVLNVILIVAFIAFGIYHYNEVDDLESKLSTAKNKYCAYESEFDCSFNYSDEVEKANVLDESIVFVLEGYGKVYYNYDCVKKLTDGKQYSFWAYNKEAAKGQGYREGKC